MTPASGTDDSYRKLDPKKAAKQLARLEDMLDIAPFSPEKTVVFSRPLSFLPGWMLVEIVDSTALPERKVIVLDDGRRAMVMEYGVPLNDEINGLLSINHDTVADFVRFYLTYARSGSDRLMLVENIDDFPWREDMGPAARKTFGRQVIPLTLLPSVDKDYVMKAAVLFRDSLFEVTITVTKQGKITISRDAKVAEDLGVFDLATGF